MKLFSKVFFSLSISVLSMQLPVTQIVQTEAMCVDLPTYQKLDKAFNDYLINTDGLLGVVDKCSQDQLMRMLYLAANALDTTNTKKISALLLKIIDKIKLENILLISPLDANFTTSSEATLKGQLKTMVGTFTYDTSADAINRVKRSCWVLYIYNFVCASNPDAMIKLFLGKDDQLLDVQEHGTEVFETGKVLTKRRNKTLTVLDPLKNNGIFNWIEGQQGIKTHFISHIRKHWIGNPSPGAPAGNHTPFRHLHLHHINNFLIKNNLFARNDRKDGFCFFYNASGKNSEQVAKDILENFVANTDFRKTTYREFKQKGYGVFFDPIDLVIRIRSYPNTALNNGNIDGLERNLNFCDVVVASSLARHIAVKAEKIIKVETKASFAIPSKQDQDNCVKQLQNALLDAVGTGPTALGAALTANHASVPAFTAALAQLPNGTSILGNIVMAIPNGACILQLAQIAGNIGNAFATVPGGTAAIANALAAQGPSVAGALVSAFRAIQNSGDRANAVNTALKANPGFAVPGGLPRGTGHPDYAVRLAATLGSEVIIANALAAIPNNAGIIALAQQPVGASILAIALANIPNAIQNFAAAIGAATLRTAIDAIPRATSVPIIVATLNDAPAFLTVPGGTAIETAALNAAIPFNRVADNNTTTYNANGTTLSVKKTTCKKTEKHSLFFWLSIPFNDPTDGNTGSLYILNK
ncbi:MAG: hypothetical protein LBB25_01780 [Holosporaceae bacterium]|jgi:hypothetical protein|nr:hypothetical protein [Holosporaceae bacterium]